METTTAQDAIAEAVRRIAEHFDPERIILFGSHAVGNAGPDSDTDLLVILPVAGSRREQAVRIDLALAGIPIPIDVLVVRPEDVEKYRDCNGAIIAEALREGKVVYERAA